jgi:metal-dependent HD superfamily phosphatase/phosphodiesterase
MLVNYEDIVKDEEVKALINNTERQLAVLGYTEHGTRHTSIVAELAGKILYELGYSQKEIELAKIAGYLHDIGNSINRVDHALTGSVLAYNLLKNKGMSYDDAAEVMMAIGNHDEQTGNAVSILSAAVILADKSDVHRSRVRNANQLKFDIHDRVNYATKESELIIDKGRRKIILNLTIDTDICPVMEYFEIFLDRMLMSKRAAHYLDCWLQIDINGTTLL